MRFDRFDLNLLVAFDALLAERSVTAAARRLNLTQSAMSAALQRLRDAVGDPLLIRHGRGMVPTPAALALVPHVSDLLNRVQDIVSPPRPFDPATSTRTFRIGASDYIATVLLAPLARRLAVIAPQMQIDIALPSDATVRKLAGGELDLILTPEEFALPDHPTQLLFEERHVVIGCAGNPFMARPMTQETFAAQGHVAVRIDGRNTYIENELARLGIVRRVEVYAPSFVQAPWLLPGTQRIALMHERLARLLAPAMGLRIAPPPFDLPPMREMAQFHATRRDDAALQWLLSELLHLARGTKA
ncbi:MAG: hypothetical protein RLZZ08_738 [Pseudomonadota bacterium]